MTTSCAGPTRRAALAFAADVVCVLVFVTTGRRNHAEGVTLPGVAETAWPFLVGLVAAWLLTGLGVSRRPRGGPASSCGWGPW